MSKDIKTFKLENVKVTFKDSSAEYLVYVDEQNLIIPSDWEYNKEIGKINVSYSQPGHLAGYNGDWTVVVQRGWFRNKAVLSSGPRDIEITSKPLPVVANVGYNSNVFYFGVLPLIISFCFYLVWRKFCRSKK